MAMVHCAILSVKSASSKTIFAIFIRNHIDEIWRKCDKMEGAVL